MRRRLDVELVRRGLARSRAHSSELIASGRVTVAGAPASAAARLVEADEAVNVAPAANEFVSRGGRKLSHALDIFGISVEGLRVLDAGASTGGFTDCLVQRGARQVVAVDVGHGQLAWSLRQDQRVDVRERTNVRDLMATDIGGPVDMVVADLSFISLRKVAEALVRLASAEAKFILLIKPQFEAGRERIGKGGVIRDDVVRREVVEEVLDALADLGLGASQIATSPITGADGNVEYLALAGAGPMKIAREDLDRVLGPLEIGQNRP